MAVSNTLAFSDLIIEGRRFCENLRLGNYGLSSSSNLNLKGREPRWNFCSMNSELMLARLRFGTESSRRFSVLSSLTPNTTGEVVSSLEQRVYDVVLKRANLVKEHQKSDGLDVKLDIVLPGTQQMLNEAYNRCGEVCAEYAKTFYLGNPLYLFSNL